MYVTIVHANGDTSEIAAGPNATLSVEHTDPVAGLVLDGKFSLDGVADVILSDGSLSEPDATDAAAKKAEELGVHLADVEGTGKDGRVTVNDVEAAAAAQAAQQ